MSVTSPDPETAPRLDRRQRKSRSALQAALLSLLEQEPYAAITVEQVIDEADVARATFYAHYQDKDALFTAVVEDCLRELTERVEPLAVLPNGFYDGRALLEVVWHALAHPALYRTVLTGAGGAHARRRMYEDLGAAVERTLLRATQAMGGAPVVPLASAARALVAQLLALVEELVEASFAAGEQDLDDGVVVEEVAAMTGIAARGLTWAIGLGGGRLRDETGRLPDYAGGAR